jgi:type I restriction enzyme M protein
MAIKKSEIYSELWKSCDELRGGMDASQYKDYILAILFVKYLSDKYSGKKDSPITIPKGGSFADMVALKGNSTIGNGINNILAKLAEENGLKGIIDVADFDNSDKLGSGKTKVDKLSNIITIFQRDSLDFSKNRADGDDILGDAYEYLMRHFATESGKSKGQFYTPSEVSQIIAKVIGAKNAKRKDWTVYDPTAGSGSLLLKVAHETPNGITIYGQENDLATTAMAQMNMWIHNNVDADIRKENTIATPLFKNKDGSLKTFDFVVSNPPFSDKTWSNGIDVNNDEYHRFEEYGIPPNKNGDYAFLLHVIKSLNSTGKGAIILPHGVLFRDTEFKIRKKIIEKKLIKGIISLPINLFYGTIIPACIIVLDKENTKTREKILMINASKNFKKDGNKNRLEEKDIHKITETFNKQLEIPNFSKLIQISDISNDKNNYNLNVSQHVSNQTTKEIEDINGHLKEGIPKNNVNAMEEYWKLFPNLKEDLFKFTQKNYVELKIEKFKIKETIFEHKDVKIIFNKINKIFCDWKENNILELNKIKIDTNPKKIIQVISESILEKFSAIEIIDKYQIYQKLMDYWKQTMQDDLYFISTFGWTVSIYEEKDKKNKIDVLDSELIPKTILIDKYFLKTKEQLENLGMDIEKISQKMQLLDEENQSEEDLFSEVRIDEKINKKSILKRCKEIKNNPEFTDELNVLMDYQNFVEQEKKIKQNIKLINKELDHHVIKKFKTLKELEIKEIVIQDKWFNSINLLLNEEFEKIMYNLSEKIFKLSEKYEFSLLDLTKDVELLSSKLNFNLKKMGYELK